jgi:hypothetical protein
MRGALLSIVTGAVAALSLSGAAQAQTLNDLYPELATVVASDGAAGDLFGYSVSLSGDTLAVGMSFDDVGTVVEQGSVRVFVRSGSTWTLQATLTAADGVSADTFGSSVSLSGDTLAVGVPLDDVGTVSNQGSVRIFVRSGTTWTAQQTLTASDGAANDQFGDVVSLDGDTLAVGVPEDDVGTNSGQGSVRIFVRSGTTWTVQQTLTASDGAAGDVFGASVSLDGDTLAVGVPLDDVGTVTNKGSVRVFTRTGTSWFAQATLTMSDGAIGDEFGASVSLDGDTLAAGVPSDIVAGNFFHGSVRVFTRNGSAWAAQATLTASDGAANDEFGYSVSLDGDTLAVGVRGDNVGTNSDQGTVRIFVRSGTTWTAQQTLTASDGAASDLFGESVSLDGDTLAVGVPFDDVGANSAQGSVRIFANYRVFNDTTNVGFTSLASAIAGSTAGARLIVGAPAFAEADGIIDASQKRFNFVAVEPIALSSTALMTVATNTVFERSPDVASAGLTVNGDLAAPLNGTVTFEQLSVGTDGQFLQRGSTILVNQNLASTSGGICYLQGPILAEAVTTAVGAQNRCAGDTDVFANYTNAGTTIVQRGILYIYGTLTNTGTLTGEVDTNFMPPAPGDGYSIGGDYAVDAASAIVLPDPVWWLRIGGSFDMAINSASRFVMDQATLEMTGIGDSAVQSLEVFARDFGAIDDGFATTNYLVGALRIRAGANVSLEDNHNNAPGKTAEAIYTNELFVPAGATLTTNGYRIYTRAATIAGTVSNPADIVVVPDVPPCPADLFPNGIVDAADLGILLSTWGPCRGACVADLDGDGQVGASDLATLLASWGPCAAN